MEKLGVFLGELFTYFFFAGTAYLLFYVIFKKAISHRIIQKKFENNDRILDEIKYSLSTIVIFTFGFLFAYHLQEQGYTKNYELDYNNITFSQIGFLILNTALMVFMHDTYFYWGHRLMHHPKIYRYVHQVHHRSTNPSPWAALYFHPFEAIIEFGIIYVFIFTIPYHEISIVLFYLYQLLVNVGGHLSFEVFDKKILKGNAWFMKFHNTVTHHNMHHKYFNYNYGLYFNIWDTLMGTVHPDYYKTFEEVVSRPSEKELEELKKSGGTIPVK